MRRGGFTLIETLVVAGVVAILATAGFLSLSQFRAKQAVESGLDELRASVEATKRRAVTQEEGSRWGVRFTNATSGISSYSVFKGSSYATGTLDRTYSFRNNVGFGNPSASSTYDAVFAPLTGALSENKVITLIGGVDGLIGDLILHTVGSITARVDNGLVGYWHLDEGTGTTAYDASGNVNSGTLTNGPTWQSGASCKAGNCLYFVTDDWVDLGNLGDPTAGTISFWFKKPNINAGSQYFLDGRGTGNWWLLQDYVSGSCVDPNGNVCFNSYVEIPSTLLSNNTWYYVAVTTSASGSKIYLDGELIDSGTGFNPDFRSVRIGTRYTNSGYLNGYMDEVRIYDRELSASEIETLYHDLQ